MADTKNAPTKDMPSKSMLESPAKEANESSNPISTLRISKKK